MEFTQEGIKDLEGVYEGRFVYSHTIPKGFVAVFVSCYKTLSDVILTFESGKLTELLPDLNGSHPNYTNEHAYYGEIKVTDDASLKKAVADRDNWEVA